MPKDEKKNLKNQGKLDETVVQATSVMELPPVTVLDPIIPAEAFMFAVLHNAIRFDDMWTDLYENHEGEIKRAIKKRAALYYAELSPTTLTDIVNKLADVVVNSLNVFAMICSSWKAQNCLQYEDEDGFNLSKSLLNCTDTGKCLQQLSDPDYKIFDFAINNTDWKRQILKQLKNIYLSDSAADFIYTFIGHFIELEPSRDGTKRLASWDPFAVTHLGGDHAQTKESFVSYLTTCRDAIDAAYNTYPFMEQLLEDLHLYSPGEKYNFTRDLAQMKLKVMRDSDNVVEDMLYMVSNGLNIYDTEHESSDLAYRVVKSSKLGGAYFTFYKDDNSASDELKYANRINININSITNALRGNVYPLNIAFYFKFLRTGEKIERFMNPYTLIHDNALPASAMYKLADLLRYQSIIDMPNDATSLAILAVDLDGDLLGQITQFKVAVNPSASDFYISAEDIESVISDATYELIIGGKSELSDHADVNTLGNNGK